VWADRVLSPFGALVLGLALIVGLVGYGLGTSLTSTGGQPSSSAHTTSATTGMSGSTSATQANVPAATQTTGNQPATYTLDSDGAKHFTLTAQQVMWSPVKGASVLAWTIGGTVPGPMIHVTAGDHVRITIINHLPEATAIHWHGLEVPTDADGVPPLGQKPIQAGETYTYDFTIQDADAGTHWYHSHYDDITQVGGGLYGAFIVDPRPGTAEARQAIHSDVDQTMFIGMLGSYYVINGKSFPDTQPITVTHGQTVRLRLIGADVNMIHPMHLHGHYFTIVAEGGHPLASPIEKDTIEVAPGDTYDVTFYAWAPPGSMYPFHCHILTHLMNPGQTGSEMGGLITLVQYTK
jgi:FtsP/CotA-like multicopper oxidase with cupredoxin domain